MKQMFHGAKMRTWKLSTQMYTNYTVQYSRLRYLSSSTRHGGVISKVQCNRADNTYSGVLYCNTQHTTRTVHTATHTVCFLCFVCLLFDC